MDALPDPSAVRDEGTIFDELVKQYNALAERAETMLIKQICGEVESDLKAHLFKYVVVQDHLKKTLILPTDLPRPRPEQGK